MVSNRRLVIGLSAGMVGMFGFGFALVPLYNVFCKVTGFNGKTSQVAYVLPAGEKASAREVTLQLLANLNEGMAWRFRPMVNEVKVHPGEPVLVKYVVKNLTDRTIVGQAIPSVAPFEAARHVHKIECFCFSQQRLKPHEEREMPVRLVLGKGLPADVPVVTLSYTFFEIKGGGGKDAAGPPAAPAPSSPRGE